MWQTAIWTGLVMAGQAASATPAGASTDEAIKIGSVLDFVIKGGPTMAAIILCSLVALTVTVERILVIRRKVMLPPQFLSAFGALAGDHPRALALCEADPSPIAKVLAAALRYRGQPREQVENAVRTVGHRVMVQLRARMRLMSALPQVATMLGLLGTIFGMIKTFQAVATSGQSLGKTEALAKGIFEAWTNTAAGLLVAIPILVAYHVLMGRIDAMASELDRVASEWIERDVPLTAPHPAVVRQVAVPLAPVEAPAGSVSGVALGTAA